MSTSPVASWLELSERAYAANVATFRAVAGPSKVGAVLKGNAYGHGLLETLSLAHGRVDVLYVITPAEALAIRAWERQEKRSRAEVLVIGAVSATDCVELARQQVSVVAAARGFSDAVHAL